MMEALDQQQAKLTSNIDAGDAGGTSSRVGVDVGTGAASGTTSEEDDYEDTNNALGLAKEESPLERHSDNNNADAADDADCVRKRKKSTDDVIDLTLANGQDSSSQMEADADSEADADAESEAADSEKSADESQTNESETSKESLLAEDADNEEDLDACDSEDIAENPQCPTIVIESDDEEPTRTSSSASVDCVKTEDEEELLAPVEEEEDSAQSRTTPVNQPVTTEMDGDVDLKSDTQSMPISEPEADEHPIKLEESAVPCDGDDDDDSAMSVMTPKDKEETQQGSTAVKEIIIVESESEEEEAEGYLSAKGDLDTDSESEEEDVDSSVSIKEDCERAPSATEKEDAERSSSIKELDVEPDSGEEVAERPEAVKGDLDIGTGSTEEDVDSSLSIRASETEDAERSSSIKELDVEPESEEEEAGRNLSVKEDLDIGTESEEDEDDADADSALPIKEDSNKVPETDQVDAERSSCVKELDEETVSAEENISLPLKKDPDEDTESTQEAQSLSVKKDLEEDSQTEPERRQEKESVRSPSVEKIHKMNAESEDERSQSNDSKTRDCLASDEEFDEKASQSSRRSSVEESFDSEDDSVTLTMDVDHPCSEDEDADATPGAVKIESDTEEDQQMAKSLKLTPPAATPTEVNVEPPVKVNGTHDSPIPEDKAKEELEEHNQLSVISNHTANDDVEDEEDEEVEEASTSQQPPLRARPLILPVRRSRSRSTSRSSTISSASQNQLVIDHPAESEQNNGKVQALMLSLKRRRSSRNSVSSTSTSSSAASVSQPEKQMKLVNSSSLLLQRLQGNAGTNVNADPASTPPAASNLLYCVKCNLQDFETLQQLNEHQEQCKVDMKEEPERKKERFFRCAQCGTVHQRWNFFIHVRDVHQKYMCMYCSLTYATVEKLSLHLENKHDIDQSHLSKDAWSVHQQKEDQGRYLVCCSCQTTFPHGSEFENHDCMELMEPCALCEVKGCHAMACRNQKKKPPKRRRRVRKQLPDQQQQQQQPEAVPMSMQAEQPESQHTESAENIPAPMPIWPTIDPDTLVLPIPVATPPPPIPKLVVPKIMLRVPKEFQKSVDAALSSTDTEDEEPEQHAATPLERETEMDSSRSPQTLPPPPQPRHSLDDLDCALMMSRMQAEVERTELEIQRIKADRKPDRKKQSKAIVPAAVLDDGLPPDAAEVMEQQPLLQAQVQQPQQQEQQRRWSLTPPASPHNTTQPPPAIITEFQGQADAAAAEEASPGRRNSLGSDCMDIDDSLNGPTAANEGEFESPEVPAMDRMDAEALPEANQPVQSPPPPFDGILVAGEDTHTIDLQLDRPLDRFTMVEFVRLCLRTVYTTCLFCNHARRIAVNGKQLVLHMIGQHRFTATVDSITAEELYAETIVAKLKSFVPQLEEEYLNMFNYCTVEGDKYIESFNERLFECFSCRYVTVSHKELYTHNRRMHAKSNIMCIMCRTNFYSYSEILCHICPGEEARSVYDLKFRCCLCVSAPTLPSAFRLMVHLRKQHNVCDICLEDCTTQAKLSAHVWKHKLLHLCYRCGIAYRNKQDISKHLFWKHGTESASCKRCLQKRWPHVYHFCVPPVTFPCEDCGFSFSKAIYLEVHKRMHTGDFRYACAEELCDEKFVSRKLLLKHATTHEAKELTPETSAQEPEQKEDQASQGPLDQAIKKETVEEEDGEETAQHEGESKATPFSERETKTECTKLEAGDKTETSEQPAVKSETRKRRKKSKRTKEYLEDLNLIAPNLSESDSSDSSDSDSPPRRSGSHGHETLPMRSSVEDLDMPKVMLSPSSESDADEQQSQPSEKREEPLHVGEAKPPTESNKQEEETTKVEVEGDADAYMEVAKREEEPDDVSDMWKNLLQNQTVNPNPNANPEEEQPLKEEPPPVPAEPEIPPPPSKVHVAWSDHDYCKLHRTPPPSPAKKHSTPKASHSGKRAAKNNASSDSDSSSSSSSNSDSDSSSCTCGSNCSCSSRTSSSSSDDSDDSNSSNAAASPTKRMRKKSLKQKKSEGSLNQMSQLEPDEDVNVTSAAEEQPVPRPPSPKAPLYNESDFDTAFSDTDEEFYDAHPQKLATELLAQKREALLAEHPPVGPRNNYDIVENSRPSTPSLPEEAAAYADKPERVRNKKKKRERKSTCKSGKLQPLASTPLPMSMSMEPPIATQMLPAESPSFLPVTPLTHRHLQPGGFLGLGSRMSEGSSCSDADGQLKRSKRQRRPNKFYGYTSDDENMSTILAPPLLVGMQLIKPQPPPLLTWAKEDLPTPPKQRSRNNNNSSSHHHHLHSNGGTRTPPTGSASRKRNRQRSQAASGGGSSSNARSAKRHKPHREEKSLPPIPTLKIRPSLLPTTALPSDSSDSSSEDEEVNVTSLGPPTPQMHPASIMPIAPPVVIPVQLPPPPPPPPAATAFNQPIPPALLPNPDFATLQYFKANNIRYPIRAPAGARQAREGESVYCYCRCPYDEVSEMIACDGDNCLIEWFHFECVGIMVAPQGRWFCAECRPKYSEGLYPGATAQ